MENYFDTEINYLKKEITRLKTSTQKSSSNVAFVSQTVTCSVNLNWEDLSQPYGSARALAIYEIIPEDDAIIMPTLSWYFGDIMQGANIQFVTRRIQFTRLVLPSGNEGVQLYFIGTENGPNSDAARAKNGEIITVSVDLKVVCDENFTLRRVV